MKKQAFFALAFLAVLPISIFADSGDDTLQFCLSKSDVVLLGTIMNEPAAVYTEEGVPNIICEFRVSDVLKGDGKMNGTTVSVNIKRFEADKKDHHPLIRKDAECILFLKQTQGNIPTLETADFWFGVQHPFPWLAKSLKRLAQKNKS
jgi:hypothetical protein